MRKTILTFVAIFLFVFILIWMISVSLKHPISGINVEQKGNDWFISGFESKNIAEDAGLRAGDHIFTVNGEQPSEYDSVKRWKNLEQFERIVVVRNGQSFEITAPANAFDMNYDLLSLLGGVFCYALSMLLFRKVPQSQSALYLSIVFVVIGFVFISLGASARGDVLGKMIISSGVIATPVIFLHFLVVLMKEKGGINLPLKYLKYLYYPAAVPALYILSLFSFDSSSYDIFQFTLQATMLFFLLGIALIFGLLIYLLGKYGKQKTYVSKLIKTVWVSLIISFVPLASLSFIPKLFYGHELLNSFYISWTVLLFPISFAYLITTKQLYNIDMIVRRIIMTTIIAIVPSGVFTGIFGFLYENENKAVDLILLFVGMVVIQSFIFYSLEYFMTKLQSVLFPRKHLLQKSIQKIAKNLTAISSFSELKDIILVDIVKTLEVFGGAVVFRYKDNMETISEGDIDIAEVERFVSSGETEHANYSSFPINSHEEYSSYLIMTRTRSNTLLGMEEMQWLNIIISYLAVSLENLHLIRKLNVELRHLAAQMPNEQEANDFLWFRKLTFELQEKERMRIATDLHDTTMQDLFFLKRRLVGVLKRYSLTKEDTEHMNSLIEYIEIINTNLRQSCFELYPHLLKEIGLIQTVEKVIERETYGSPFEIDFQADRDSRIEKRDMETKRHLFRMIQELLNNAKKHSEASKVVIRLKVNQEGLMLSYDDDGVGFDPNRTAPKQIGSSGMGIEQLKSRVLHLNGRWELQTGKGNGVKIRIALPSFEGMIA